MTALTDTARSTAEVPDQRHESIWGKAIYKLRRDRAGMVGFAIVMAYFIAASGVWLGIWGTHWSDVEGPKWSPMSSEFWFGTNIIGQDIFQRAIYSTKTAFEIGLVVAVLSTLAGAVLGALAGFFSGTSMRSYSGSRACSTRFRSTCLLRPWRLPCRTIRMRCTSRWFQHSGRQQAG
jgi:ABC-type dipeptide/oligopeptide/nickel transport system permease subunit